MNTLGDELKKIGYSDDLLKVIASTSEMDCPNIDVNVAEYETFDEMIISSNNISMAICNTKIEFS